MNNLNYSYNLTSELFREGVEVSGLYNTSRKRQIIITVLCAFIVCNSVYGFIAAQKINTTTLVFMILAILIDLYIWFGPELQIKKLVKQNANNELIDIDIGENGILFGYGEGEKKVYIEPNRYKGFLENENMFVFFFSRQYAILPKADKTSEQIDFTKDYLENYRNYKKTDEEPEFEIFKPEDGFVGEFDTDISNSQETNEKGSN